MSLPYTRPEMRRRDGLEAPACDRCGPLGTRSEAFAEDLAGLARPPQAVPAPTTPAPARRAPRPRFSLRLFPMRLSPMR